MHDAHRASVGALRAAASIGSECPVVMYGCLHVATRASGAWVAPRRAARAWGVGARRYLWESRDSRGKPTPDTLTPSVVHVRGDKREAQAALSLPASLHCEDGRPDRRTADGLRRFIGFMLHFERCCSANPPITRISSFATRLQHARSLD